MRYIDAESEQDIILVEEAAASVTLQLTEGDRYDQITQNVYPFGSPNAATVIWTSSDEAVIKSE